jgi:hypothetical protein
MGVSGVTGVSNSNELLDLFIHDGMSFSCERLFVRDDGSFSFGMFIS